MSQILNSLIVSDVLEPQRALQDVMGDNIKDYVLTFTTYGLDQLAEVDRNPDIVFIESREGLTPAGITQVRGRFPKKTYVALIHADDSARREFLGYGVDEVMSIDELRSEIGRRLLEKLLAMKDLAAAEIRIEQSEERFRGIIEHSHDIIMLLDEDATVVYTSPAFGRLMGYESWEVLGQGFFALVHDDERAAVERKMRSMMSAWVDDGMALEYRFRRKDGAWRYFETIATNLLRTDTVRAVVLNSRDMTHQKAVEDELARYRQHLESLVETRTHEAEVANRRADAVVAASSTALIALNDGGFITFMSKNYLDVYPGSVAKLVPGTHIGDTWDAVAAESGLAPDDPASMEMKRWLLDPHGSIEWRRPNGVWVRLHARRVEGQGGVVIATTDISDYKRQQALLASQSAELAEALDKEKEVVEQQRTFISMVSHEFRTPLAIIDGNAQILEKRGELIGKEALLKRAGTIRAAVDRLVGLIETILSANMIENGKLALSPVPCDLGQIIREACADQQDISPRHRIRPQIEGLPPSLLLDAKLVRQMMANLLSNAVKYSPDGKVVEIAARVEEGEVVIDVRDRGIGIPETEQPRLFQKYFRASTSGGIPGSGLGLSLVKQFVELHNGTIGLKSRVGEGTVVTVRLPLVKEKEALTIS